MKYLFAITVIIGASYLVSQSELGKQWLASHFSESTQTRVENAANLVTEQTDALLDAATSQANAQLDSLKQELEAKYTQRIVTLETRVNELELALQQTMTAQPAATLVPQTFDPVPAPAEYSASTHGNSVNATNQSSLNNPEVQARLQDIATRMQYTSVNVLRTPEGQ